MESKQTSAFSIFSIDNVYSLTKVAGYVFIVSNQDSTYLLGIYKKFGKLYAIVDLETGLQVCTSHYRADSKDDCVNRFIESYLQGYVKWRSSSVHSHYARMFDVCYSSIKP